MAIPFKSPIDMGNNPITNTQDPSAASDVATKNYVDSLVPGGSGTALARFSTNFTTASIADKASDTGSFSHAKSALLYKVVVDRYCRLRLYATAAGRDSEPNRVIGTKSAWNSKILLEIVFTAATGLTFDMQGPAILDNADGTVVSTLYWAVTNLSGATSTVTATFTSLRLE
jgi:hypothetical protein